jgi:hypothetical protein
VLLGVWLIIAPFALPAGAMMTNAWAVNDVIVGILLVAFSWWMVAAIAPPIGAAWFEMLCGVWLIVAPFVIGYSATMSAVWNDVVCGIIAIVVAVVAAQAMTRTPRMA